MKPRRSPFVLTASLCLARPVAALARASVTLTVNAGTTVRTVDTRVFGLHATQWEPQAGSAQTITFARRS